MAGAGGFLSCREQPPECRSHYPDAPEDKLPGITDKQQLNEEEARGVVRAEAFLLDLELPVALTIGLLLDIHRVAFGHLYDWAGQWRRSNPNVGSFVPPPFQQVPPIGSLFQPIRICGVTGRNV